MRFLGASGLIQEPPTTSGAQPEGAHPHNGDRSTAIDISSRRLNDGIVIAVCGEIDLATAPVVEQRLLDAGASHDLVALDLSETSFMDSTGLHMVVSTDRALRQRGGRLVVLREPPQIRRLFELTRLIDHVELVDSATELT
jgi:anti-sigma B factor antagonist